MTNYPTKKLGEVLELCDSGTWGDESSDGMPLLRSTNMQNGELVLSDVKYINVPKEKVERYRLREGDILITKSSGSVDHIGKSLFITKEMDGKYGFSNFTQRLRVDKNQVLPKWVYLKISNPATRDFLLGASQTTTGLRNLKIPALKELEIPLPPLSKQKKIVAKLESVLAKISEAKKLRIVARENADNLLSAELHKIFEEGKMRGWEEKELEGIVTEIKTGPFGSTLHKSDYVANGIPVINPQDIKNGTIVPLGKTMVSEATKARLIQYILKEGDIIFARRGEMGRCALVTSVERGWLCGTGSLILRLNGKVNERFVFLFLQSATVKRFLEGVSVGATLQNLNQGIMKKIKIPLPPLAEQKKIVARLDSLSEKVEKIKNLQSATQNDFIALEQSVLTKSFSGQ